MRSSMAAEKVPDLSHIMNTAIPDYASIAATIGNLQTYLSSKIRDRITRFSRVCSLLERVQFGLNPIEKPLGSFLFLGPTGVGKTQLTLEFAHYLFGDNHVFRFDMSEFLHLDNVKLFMGDEAGRTGRLGEVLSKHQKGVLLFDEIEKAHRLIWDLFLQMLDAARITLADHRAYDLSGFYIVCTSNIGSQQLLRPTRLPFTTLERAVIAELHRFFRPELIGRFDEKISHLMMCLNLLIQLTQWPLSVRNNAVSPLRTYSQRQVFLGTRRHHDVSRAASCSFPLDLSRQRSEHSREDRQRL